jgi:hypothetical protein
LCGSDAHAFDKLPARYAYLLGMYLGDGCLDLQPRTWRMRVALDARWPGIVAECADAMRDVFPQNRVTVYRPDRRSRCLVAMIHSRQLLCLFPQHGVGAKHLRRIELQGWQWTVVKEQPHLFLRGLIHSDGCRVINRVRRRGKDYAYPRYNFTNASKEIRHLFTSVCDLLGIEWRQMNARNISVAKRDSVAQLDTFVGPKR